MSRYEYIKSLNIEDTARFIEGLLAIALGTDEFADVERRIEWLKGENGEGVMSND